MLSGPEHRIDLANPRYLRLVGERHVVGRTVAEALPDAAAQGYVDLLDQVYRSGEVFYAPTVRSYDPCRCVPAAPGERALRRLRAGTLQPIRDQAGGVSGIFVEGADATERVLAERRRETLVRLTDALRTLDSPAELGFAAAQILGEALEVSRVGYGTIDHEAETLHVQKDWNAPGIATLAGMLRLRDFGSFIDDLKRDRFIAIGDVREDARTEAAAAALEGRSARSFVNVPVIEQGRLVAVLYVNHDGARAWSAEELALVREVAERTRTAVERARGELALRASEARLREANETLEAKIEARTRELLEVEAKFRQSQKMEAIGQLTGGLAHDFNNLLGTISTSLQVMQKRLQLGQADDLQRYIDMAQGSVRRAAALTQRLLAFSRRQTLDPKATDVNRLIAGLEEMIRRTVGPAVRVEVSGASGVWLTRVDASQLENALLNLCLNARDAMAPEGGLLAITTANESFDERAAAERELAPGEYVAIAVADSGSGMSAEVIARAFDPFFTTKPLGTGTGLGLSMVYGFVRQSGGQVRVRSELGRGTTMTLYLPRHLGPSEPETVPRGAGLADRADGECVLLIEDEATLRLLVAEELEGLGYRGDCRRRRPCGPERAADRSPRRPAAQRRRPAGWTERPPGRRRGTHGTARPEGSLHHRLCRERRDRQRPARAGHGSDHQAVRHVGSERESRRDDRPAGRTALNPGERPFKIPESVLVVIHTRGLEVLLLERADAPGFWQSVTGSKETPAESLLETCIREVGEETAIVIGSAAVPLAALSDWDLVNVYDIYPQWQHRYAAGVTRNTEHVFGLCVPRNTPVRPAPREHRRFAWLDWRAAADRCFSSSNAEAILQLPRRFGAA